MPGICQGDPGGSQMTPRWKSRALSQTFGRKYLERRYRSEAGKKTHTSLQCIGWTTVFQSVVAVCFTEKLSCDKVVCVCQCVCMSAKCWRKKIHKRKQSGLIAVWGDISRIIFFRQHFKDREIRNCGWCYWACDTIKFVIGWMIK